MKSKTIQYTTYTTAALLALCAAVTSVSTGCAGTSNRESAGQYVDDSTITTKVKANLISDDTVKARQVTVETYKGIVQLSGFVDTPEQKDRAAQIASSVVGVRDVRNNIVVKSSS